MSQERRCLIGKSADVKVADNRGFTLAHMCVTRAHYEREQSYLVRLLLDRGVDVNAVTYESDTPLHFGAAECATGEVRVLLERRVYACAVVTLPVSAAADGSAYNAGSPKPRREAISPST